jgi:hypothetical protein
MKIYFCDTCNESIPLQDIKDNRAATLKGKIFCKNCNPLKEINARAGRAPGNTLVVVLLVAVVILAGSGLVVMLMNQFGQKVEYATAGDLGETKAHVQDLSGELADLSRAFESIQETLEEDRARFSKVESELLVVRGDLQGVRSETENMSKNFQSVTNVRERLDQFVLKQDEFAASLSDCDKKLTLVGSQNSDLDTRLQALALALSQGGGTAAKQTGTQDDSSNFVDARVQEIQKKLESKDDGVRYEAVCDVLDERLKGALPYVLPRIEDSDQFVQIMAIQTVGEFLYTDALPYLIKVLRDPDVTVRYEALRQLVRMSGQNALDFDVHGPESEREKAIKKWEKWQKENDK